MALLLDKALDKMVNLEELSMLYRVVIVFLPHSYLSR